MQLYLAVTPDKLPQASRYTSRLAHVAYRIGPEGRLTRRNMPIQVRGGIMVLGDQGCGVIRDCSALCRDVWRECANRGFNGVLADFELPPNQDRTSFLISLSQVLSRNGKQIFVPEVYGQRVPLAAVTVCTAISGGIFRQRLEDACRRFDGRVALDLQRLRMDFPLPCPSGEGRPMSREELRELMERLRPAVFYSADLCAKYFTCTHDGTSRFILFDDAGTLQKKLQAGQAMALKTAFVMYPEVEDLLPRLFPPRQGRRGQEAEPGPQ